MRIPIGTTVEEKIREKVIKTVEESNGKYHNPSHFVELAIQEKLLKENE